MKLTVVLSEDRTSHSARQKMEQALLAGLSHRPGVDLAILPHLYDLAPDGPGMQFLRGVLGDLVVLGWLYPRAAYWVLGANHVRGRMGHTSFFPDEELESLPPAPTGKSRRRRAEPELPNRTIWCIDLRDRQQPEPVLAEVERIMVAVLGAPLAAPLHVPAGSTNGKTRIEEITLPRWYPVVDYDRCGNCQECLEFCTFEVFGVDQEGMLLVLRPDDCRDGCPACARICPSGAILFPHHDQPAMAGDASAPRDGMKSNPSPAPDAPSVEDLARIEQERATSMLRKRRPDKPKDKDRNR